MDIFKLNWFSLSSSGGMVSPAAAEGSWAEKADRTCAEDSGGAATAEYGGEVAQRPQLQPDDRHQYTEPGEEQCSAGQQRPTDRGQLTPDTNLWHLTHEHLTKTFGPYMQVERLNQTLLRAENQTRLLRRRTLRSLQQVNTHFSCFNCCHRKRQCYWW